MIHPNRREQRYYEVVECIDGSRSHDIMWLEEDLYSIP